METTQLMNINRTRREEQLPKARQRKPAGGSTAEQLEREAVARNNATREHKSQPPGGTAAESCATPAYERIAAGG